MIGGSPARGKKGFANTLPWKASRNAMIVHFLMERKSIPKVGAV
jgi:hypothetical protein